MGTGTPTGARGGAVDVKEVFNNDGGRSQISVSTRQGARRQRFLALMVAALGSPASTPPRRPTVDVS
jgi:hypothetical protein